MSELLGKHFDRNRSPVKSQILASKTDWSVKATHPGQLVGTVRRPGRVRQAEREDDQVESGGFV